MELIFVRHAQPGWDDAGLAVDDPPLTERGEQQAQLLAEAASAIEAGRLLVSPLQRAQQTAKPIAEQLGLEPVTLDWLAEISMGLWHGTPTDVVEQAFRANRDKPIDQQWEGIDGGETFRDFHRRVTEGFQALLDTSGIRRTSQHPPLWQLASSDERIVVVAHAGTNAVALSYLLGIEPVPWEWERFVSFHASLSVIRPVPIGGGHTFSLLRFGDTTHLPAELHTR